MSTPTGKPFDLSFFPPNHEHPEPEPGGDDAPFVSPYAPKRASARPATEPASTPAASDDQPGDVERDQREPPASAQVTPPAPVDLDAQAAARRSAPGSTLTPGRTPARGERTFGEQDIERLEASLRWLQREETASRLLHGNDRASTPSRRSLSPRSLEPERMAPPPERGARRSYWPLYVLVASAVGAGAAYLVAAPDRTPSPSVQTPRPQVASFETKSAAPGSIRDRQSLFPTVARDDDVGATAPNEPTPDPANEAAKESAKEPAKETAKEPAKESSKPTQVARLSDGPPPATMTARPAPPPAAAPPSAPPSAAEPAPTPAPAPTQAAPAREPVRSLDPEAVKLLIKQGEQFVADGDLVTARTVFQRAAEAGDANAAMALAATYDPQILSKLGVVGVGADIEKARIWYQRAANLGLPEASRRLSLLSNR